jgi:dolichol-phosphate mannosyltransferase
VIGRGGLIVVATYNERENIEPLMTWILENASGCRVLVIHDSSPDGTGECVR